MNAANLFGIGNSWLKGIRISTAPAAGTSDAEAPLPASARISGADWEFAATAAVNTQQSTGRVSTETLGLETTSSGASPRWSRRRR